MDSGLLWLSSVCLWLGLVNLICVLPHVCDATLLACLFLSCVRFYFPAEISVVPCIVCLLQFVFLDP